MNDGERLGPRYSGVGRSELHPLAQRIGRNDAEEGSHGWSEERSIAPARGSRGDRGEEATDKPEQTQGGRAPSL